MLFSNFGRGRGESDSASSNNDESADEVTAMAEEVVEEEEEEEEAAPPAPAQAPVIEGDHGTAFHRNLETQFRVSRGMSKIIKDQVSMTVAGNLKAIESINKVIASNDKAIVSYEKAIACNEKANADGLALQKQILERQIVIKNQMIMNPPGRIQATDHMNQYGVPPPQLRDGGTLCGVDDHDFLFEPVTVDGNVNRDSLSSVDSVDTDTSWGNTEEQKRAAAEVSVSPSIAQPQLTFILT
jgi:hypothetical protein